MTAEEKEIHDYLSRCPDRFVPAAEICQRAGTRTRYALDRNWAMPILRRMELDGWVESDQMGGYRLRPKERRSFREALADPTAANLGDTAIIRLEKRSQAA